MVDLSQNEKNAFNTPQNVFPISLPHFEGPLDLLLHLIREHQVDIFDIPIALITEKYLAHLDLMREINLDSAGGFLVMASTLLQLKSRMLLPRDERATDSELMAKEEQADPRVELVCRLLKYQKYKAAADQLLQVHLLDRCVFVRKAHSEPIEIKPGEIGLKELSTYKLIEALDRVFKALKQDKQREIIRERFTLTQAVYAITEKIRNLGEYKRMSFYTLFENATVRSQVVITFLALLEMCKHRLLCVFQHEEHADIFISARAQALSANDTYLGREIEGEYE